MGPKLMVVHEGVRRRPESWRGALPLELHEPLHGLAFEQLGLLPRVIRPPTA